jgi:hypothetical protein
MPVTGDQRALLKLVVERGQTYEDIAGLLGTDAADVRERARRALAAAAGADLDRSANVTDFLLGQADPIARADAVRHLSRDAEDRDRAERALLAIEAIAPNATLPRLPESRTPKPKAKPTAGEARPLIAGTPLGTPQRRLIALLGGVALAIVVAVIAIAGGGDGEGNGSDEPVDPDFVRVKLKPAAGVSGSGVAVIGQTDDDQPFIELDLEGLGQIGGSSRYVLWMLTDDDQGIPVSPIDVADGEFRDRMPLLSPADLVAAFSQSIVISVMSSDELRESLAGLLEDFTETTEPEETQLPVTKYKARTILRGEIPTLAELAEEAEGSESGS